MKGISKIYIVLINSKEHYMQGIVFPDAMHVKANSQESAIMKAIKRWRKDNTDPDGFCADITSIKIETIVETKKIIS